MKSLEGLLVYWDTSAIISTLFADDHSDRALKIAKKPGVHLLSSLAHAEVAAVISRIEREREASSTLIESAREAFLLGPWRFVSEVPRSDVLDRLSRKWPLRGADLWHLACAKTLAADLPELAFLTFDLRLDIAVQGEGMHMT